MPLDQSMLGNSDGAVLIRLVTSELLVDPRMRVSAESQPTLWLPLFDCSYQALDTVLASIYKVFFMLDDLTDFTNEGVVVANHSIKAIIGMDAMRPAMVQ